MEQDLSRSTTIAAVDTLSNLAVDVTRTLREATKLALNNKLLILRVLVFLFLAPFFLLVLIHSLVAGPLLQKVEDSYERSALDQRDLRALVAIEVPFFAAFCIVWLFGTAVTISAAASAYSGKSLILKDLMIWLKCTYKKILNVGLFVGLLVVVFLVLVSATFTTLIGRKGAALAFTWIIRAVAAVVYPYLASICALGLVIAVLEDDCHSGLALEKARRLLKDRKLQACILALILTLLSIPVCILFYVTSTDDDDEIPFITGCPFIFIATALFCFANFFTSLVFTLFYFECKACEQQSQAEKGEIQLGPGYCLVPIN